MKLDAIGRNTFLTFKVIKKSNAGNLYGHIGILESRCRGEHRVELRTRVGDAGRKWTDRPTLLGQVDGWFKELLLRNRRQAATRRQRTLSLMAEDPMRIPDYVLIDPTCPLTRPSASISVARA